MVLEAKKSKIKALADLESGESPSPDLQMAVFSLGPCMVGRMRELHGVAKSQTRLSDFTFTFYFHAWEKEMATHSSILAWRIPGTDEPNGLLSWGRTESDMTEAT